MCTGQSTPPPATFSNLTQSIIGRSDAGTPAADQRRRTMALAMRAMPGLGSVTAVNQKLGG